jgi:hypothetical protein
VSGFAIHRSVPVAGGSVAWVDQCDYSRIAALKWCRHSQGYPVRGVGPRGHMRVVAMHHHVMQTVAGQRVDHINRNPLDNRRRNLRLCTHAENNRNKRMRSDNTSGYRGVIRDGRRGHWRAVIGSDGEHHYLGSFRGAKDAARAYDAAALVLHGSFASLNFPEVAE